MLLSCFFRYHTELESQFTAGKTRTTRHPPLGGKNCSGQIGRVVLVHQPPPPPSPPTSLDPASFSISSTPTSLLKPLLELPELPKPSLDRPYRATEWDCQVPVTGKDAVNVHKVLLQQEHKDGLKHGKVGVSLNGRYWVGIQGAEVHVNDHDGLAQSNPHPPQDLHCSP
ncbi:hypothetical protein TrVE_jg13758 [Triparma verrucosa]|uniref:Uncharacterized protein n=1 Tax=Triparma verrucosa TaxID=1606542 RepID=A0A9W7CEI5_9STRA|nr:hypothetical protein TrVE_jg13758 [Triparma verrucosa]